MNTGEHPIEALMFALCRPMKCVYPGYLALRIKKALRLPDPENIYTPEIGDIETIGDCRYAMTVTDVNGTEYRITVEVAPSKSDSAVRPAHAAE